MKQVILTIALMLSLADTAAASLTGLSDGENNVRNTLANRDGLIGFVGFHFKKKPQKGRCHKDNDCLQSLCLCHLLPSGVVFSYVGLARCALFLRLPLPTGGQDDSESSAFKPAYNSSLYASIAFRSAASNSCLLLNKSGFVLPGA